MKCMIFKMLTISAVFGFSAQALAQSAIETVTFMMSGYEISADGREWKGQITLPNGTKEWAKVEQKSNCQYELTSFNNEKPFVVTAIDFSKVRRIQFLGDNTFSTFVSFGGKVIESQKAVCVTSSDGKTNCTDEGGAFLFPSFILRGDPNKNRDIMTQVISMNGRMQQAYGYFQREFCKPRAF